MTDAEIVALLEAHDALVKGCVDGSLAFDEFVIAYGEFPRGYGLDDGAAEVRALARFRRRIEFHAEVAGVLSSFSAVPGTALGLAGGAGDFLSKAVLQRLRALAARHPDFKGF
jgi:hypothetical protein